MTGAYNDFNNNGFTNVGDVVNYQFTVGNPNNVVINNLNVSNQSLITGGSLNLDFEVFYKIINLTKYRMIELLNYLINLYLHKY